MIAGTDLPAFTLWQPWALAVTRLRKRVENRAWSTRYRGPIAIHAGSRWDGPAVDFPPLQEAWAQFVRELPPMNSHHGPLRKETAWVEFGAVVAVADLTHVCGARTPVPLMKYFVPRGECDCGPWALDGQFHWLLDNVRALPEPVPCRGAQKLWKMPNTVEAAVRAQL